MKELKELSPQVPLTLDGFIDWLESKGPTQLVGWAMQHCDCPIARCIDELAGLFGVTGDPEPSVGPLVTQVGHKYFLTPLWASKFIREIDREPGPVSAGRALRVAKGIRV